MDESPERHSLDNTPELDTLDSDTQTTYTRVPESSETASEVAHHNPTHILRKIATHDEQRIEQVCQRLNSNGRAILKALPALLHYNQASLPGYVKGCAAGIARYTPTKPSLLALTQLIPTFNPRLARSDQELLDGLYLMGSAGSIAQTNSSDIDFWICTSKTRVRKLQKKLELLTLWAAQFGIELQGFAVHPEQFNGQPSRSNSYLLLDEFYRSACRMAGKPLRWWLEPASDIPVSSPIKTPTSVASAQPDQEVQTEQATTSRATPPAAPRTKQMFVDFGRIQSLPEQDLYAACLHAVHQAFLNPYKGLLKLALLVAYAHGQPLLSDQFKQYALKHHDTADLDVYVVLARYLENYYAHDAIWPVLQTAWLKKVSLHNRRLKDNSLWQATLHRWQFDPDTCGPEGNSFSNYAKWNQQVILTIEELYSRIRAPELSDISHPTDNPLWAPQNALQEVFDYYRLNPAEQLPALANYEYTEPFDCTKQSTGAWEIRQQGELLAEHSTLMEQLVWWLNNKLDDGIAQAQRSGATGVQLTQIEHTKRLLKRASRTAVQAYVNIEADYEHPSRAEVADVTVVRLQQYPAPIGQKLVARSFNNAQAALAFLAANAELWPLEDAHGSGQFGSQKCADAFMQLARSQT